MTTGKLLATAGILLALVSLSFIPAAAQSVSFNSPKDYTVGLGPRALAIGDVNLDGNQDIVVTNEIASTVSILLGNGKGGFQPRQDFAAGSTPVAIAGGDFNNDGNPDLLVANDPDTGLVAVSVLLGIGNGSFLAPIQTDLGTFGGPVSVTVADFNGDGKLDVAACLSLTNEILVLLGKGDGTFQQPITMTLGVSPLAVAASDFNGDKKADLAIASSGSGEVLVLLGNGDGTFQLPLSFGSGGATPSALAVGDLNGDGKQDLVVGNYGFGNPQGNVAVLLGNGDGTFQEAKTSVPFNYAVPYLAVGDLNGDGNQDVVVNWPVGQDAIDNGLEVSVFWGNGDGTLRTPTSIFMAGADGVGIGDFNKDHRLDLAGAINAGNVVQVRLNTGNGTFQKPQTVRTNGVQPISVVNADFNNDGKQDLVVANSAGSFNVSLLLGNGNGTFQSAVTISRMSGPAVFLAAGDFNNDGNVDLAMAVHSPFGGQGQILILLGNGDGTFQTSKSTGKNIVPQQLILADFNQDGNLDIAALGNNEVWIFLGKGDGTFRSAVGYLAGLPTSLATGDLNGDGKLDIAVNSSDGFVYFLFGNGDGTFSSATSLPTPAAAGGIALGNLNGDGKLDVIAGARQNGSYSLPSQFAVFLGNGNGTFQTPSTVAVPNDAEVLALADFNNDGFLDVSVLSPFSDDVSFFPGKGDGSFGIGTNFAVGAGPLSLAIADFTSDRQRDEGEQDACCRQEFAGGHGVSFRVASCLCFCYGSVFLSTAFHLRFLSSSVYGAIMNSSTRLVLVAGILLALSFLPAAAQSYTVTDLGTLGGKTSGATAINDLGHVAGVANVASGNQHAIFWSPPSGMIDLGLLNLGDFESIAYGINNVGQVVGTSGDYAFIWTQLAGMQDIGTLGGIGATAYGINNVGQVAGVSARSDGLRHAFLWSASGGMQDIGTLGGSGSVAYAVNDAGQVVGYSLLADKVTSHAFLWTQTGGMRDLGTLGGPTSFAAAISSDGTVVGYSGTSTSVNAVAFIWTAKQGMASLGTTNSATMATGINSLRQVVGTWVLPLSDGPPRGRNSTGFLWTKWKGLQNLNSLVKNKQVVTVQSNGINRFGQIAATGSNGDAILLTPTK